MKFLALVFLGILLLALPLSAAQEEEFELELNMTLDDSFCPANNDTASDYPCNSARAVAYVNVTLVEPPPEPPITGLFLAQFNFEELFSDITRFFSELFGLSN